VRVMHVMPSLQPPLAMEPYLGGWQTIYVPLPVEDETILQKKQEHKGQALLKRTCDLLQRSGIESIPVLRRGDAATEIIDYVKANQIDLIVAGSRGLSSVQGLVDGKRFPQAGPLFELFSPDREGTEKGVSLWK